MDKRIPLPSELKILRKERSSINGKSNSLSKMLHQNDAINLNEIFYYKSHKTKKGEAFRLPPFLIDDD